MPSPGILRRFEARRAITTHLPSRFCAWASHNPSSKPRRSPCRLGMPPAELLDDTLYDIVNNDDTNTNEGKGASLVAALTSTLLARHIAGRCDPLKTKSSCRITMMATGANRYPQRGCIRFILHIRTCNFFLQLRDRCQRGSKGESSFRYPVRFTGNTKPSRNYIEHCAAEKPRQYPAIPEDNVLSSPAHCCSCGRGGGT